MRWLIKWEKISCGGKGKIFLENIEDREKKSEEKLLKSGLKMMVIVKKRICAFGERNENLKERNILL